MTVDNFVRPGASDVGKGRKKRESRHLGHSYPLLLPRGKIHPQNLHSVPVMVDKESVGD